MIIRFVALIAMLASSPTYCSPRQDSSGGIWSDDFSDYTGLSHIQQAALSGFGGITVDSGLQSWSQPQSSTLFSEPFVSIRATRTAGIVTSRPGTALETLTLWRNRWAPTENISIGAICDVGTAKTQCSLDPTGSFGLTLNGEDHASQIAGIPGEFGAVGAAVWGGNFQTVPLSSVVNCSCAAISANLGIHTLQTAGLPLMFGAKERGLIPGVEYDVTALAIQQNPEAAGLWADYLTLSVVNKGTGVPFASQVLNENQITNKTIPTQLVYGGMTPFSVHVAGFPQAEWDFKVLPSIPVPGHNHCTALGPVYVTASVGNYKSPVLDTLSNKTQWVSISWSIDQSTDYADSGSTPKCTVTPLGCGSANCICPESAIAITPVMLDYSVDNTAPYSGTSVNWGVEHYDWQLPGLQTVPTQDYTIMNSSTPMADATGAGPLNGRYFQYKLEMYGRGSAAGLYPALAPGAMHPGTPNIYFGGLRPTVRRVAVNYFACAAMVISDAIAPSSVKKWGKVTFRTYQPTPGASVVIDVLSEDGVVLKAGIISGDSIGDLDIYSYPRLKLRATLVSDPADCNQRPVLESWKMDWQPNPELLTLDRNGFRPDRGETVKAQVRVDRPGRVIVRVHDVSGQAIKLLLDGDQPAQATLIVWDGRNERGDKVAPGVYFMSAGVPGAGKVKRVAVLR